MEEVTLQTSMGAANGRDEQDEPGTPAGQDEQAGTDSGPALHTPHQPDTERVQERGVALHGMSEDEEADSDEDGAQEMTEEEMATAKAVLDDPSYDQEGLVLTGGGWLSTIKKAALESKLTEKELAARMKKAKISQSSLENEVFVGTPSCHSSADTSPGTLQNAPPPSSSKSLPVGTRLSMKTVADRFTVDPGNEPPREPAQKRKKNTDGFPPPQYSSIRAARANTATITPLGGIGGVNRTPTRQGIGAATGGFEVEGDTRQYSVQNYHVTVKKRNVSATILKPPIGKGCLSCPTPHSLAENLREGLPIVIFLTNQTFPPVLPPTGEGNCTVIIRVEDSELWELEEVFYDRFKSLCKPHGSIPSGSLVLVGSMSHLAKNGLNYYAPILVETMTRMAGKVGPGVNVIPFVPVPVGGIGSETLARDMIDLDSWIVSTGAGQATGLPDTRDAFWRIILANGGGGRRVYTSSAPLFLQAGIKNSRIRPFMSGAFV